MKRAAALFMLSGVILLCPAVSAADMQDVEELLRIAPGRNMGSPYREVIDRYVEERFKATGFEHGRMTFPTAVYVPGRAELHLPGGATLPLHSMAPNTAHPGNLPKGAWQGELIDLGAGNPEDMTGGSITNAAVLIDMDSHKRWITALELGAAVIIFAGSEKENSRQGASKLCRIPLAVPRFYLTHGDSLTVRKALGEGKRAKVELIQTRPGRWKAVTAGNDWVLVPGGRHADQVVHIQAYKDGGSFVPEFTPGAEGAANLALLLRLLDHYTRNKPQCTLVFSAVSDHCNCLRGEEFYMGFVIPDMYSVEDELDDRREDLEKAEEYARIYADRSPEHIAALRTADFDKKPIKTELDYRRNTLLYRKSGLSNQLSQLKKQEIEASKKAALEKELDAVDKELGDTVAIMGVFQRFGRGKEFTELIPERQALLIDLMKRVHEKYENQVQDARAQLDEMGSNSRLRKLLEDKSNILCVSLDMSFGNERMGFFFQGGGAAGALPVWQSSVLPLARLSLAQAAALEGGSRYFTDTILKKAGLSWQNYLGGSFAMASTVGQCAGLPSLTLSTTEDTRDLRFTPSDTLENADTTRMGEMLDFAQRLIPALLEHKGFVASVHLPDPEKKAYRCSTWRYSVRRLDPFSVEVPTERVRNAVVVVWPPGTTIPGNNVVPDQVAVHHIALTDRQGSAIFRGSRRSAHIEVYRFDADFGRINMALDAGASARILDPAVRADGSRWSWYDRLALMFDCVQTDLVGLYDPATRAPFSAPVPKKITILDAVRESSPDHYGITGIDEARSKYKPILAGEGIACVFTEKDTPIKIISDKLLLINASRNCGTGVGFQPGDSRLRTMGYTAARDVQMLNKMRMGRIEEKAVSNPAARELYEEADGLIQRAEAARDKGDQREFFAKAVEGLGKAQRSYTMVRSTTADLIKAVAVFLTLVIPFCLFLMKLLTPWTDIRLQITVFLVIFGAMAAALAFLHPAFSLSQTPMIVLLAFVMLGLAVFVMAILQARFDAGLKRMVEEARGVESTESSRKTLAGVAFSVGINNMRRRRIRTTLTSVTIVLVTFTMLSVISVGQSLQPYRRKTEDTAPYNGVLFAKAAMGKIRQSEADHVARIFRDHGTVVRRTWTERRDSMGAYFPHLIRSAKDPNKKIRAKSLLGLQKEEDDFLARIPLVAGRWFSGDAAREIILSVEAASYLGIGPEWFSEQDLLLQNHKLRLVGLVDDDGIADMKDLAQVPLLPLEHVASQVAGKAAEMESVADAGVDFSEGPAPTPDPLRSVDCALVPIEFARSIPNTDYRSLAVKTPDAGKAWQAAEHFVGATGILTFSGLKDDVTLNDGTVLSAGQYGLAPSVGLGVGGVSKVLIPICLAATIILNTMLGAVMERKREISIYNSIGLNPTHVFVFFVAEAVVFGLIGAVAGYLIGQALAQSIVTFGWLSEVNLNFSSMAVIVVIFAAVLTVVVSTLYPALVATRASVPSGQRRWKLPTPVGDELRLDFPFSYAERHLPGVCAFLHEFMDLNSEASSGQFLAQDARFGFVRDDENRKTLAMVYNITPVPFDLGVNQRMEIYGYYQPKVRACVLGAHLTRLKGDKGSWLIVNQPFLEGLRTRLLSWRSQSQANQERFCSQGEAMFAGAGDFPMKRTEG